MEKACFQCYSECDPSCLCLCLGEARKVSQLVVLEAPLSMLDHLETILPPLLPHQQEHHVLTLPEEEKRGPALLQEETESLVPSRALEGVELGLGFELNLTPAPMLLVKQASSNSDPKDISLVKTLNESLY